MISSARKEIKKKGEADSIKGRNKKIAENKKNEQSSKRKKRQATFELTEIEMFRQGVGETKKGTWIAKRRRAVCVNCLKRNA